MKKTVLILMLGVLFIAANLFAADGDLIVEGNVGISGSVVINEQANDVDFRMEGTSDPNLFMIDAGNNVIGIGNTGYSGAMMFITPTDKTGLAVMGTQDTAANGYGASYRLDFTGTANRTSTVGFNNQVVIDSDKETAPTGGVNRVTFGKYNGTPGISTWTSPVRVLDVYLERNANNTRNFTLNGGTRLLSLRTNISGGSGTITGNNFYGIYAENFDDYSFTNHYGIYLEQQTAGTNNTNLFIGTGATTGSNWSIYNNSSYKNYFAGALGIGTDSPGSYKLYVAGNVYATGSITQNSDVSFKQNINSIDNALNKVMNLKGVIYEWKKEKYKDKGFDEGRHYGVVAQEVEKVLPETVKEGPDGHKGVAYAEIIPVLIEAVKEQQRIMENQKKEMEELRAKVQKLEVRDFVAKAQNENQL